MTHRRQMFWALAMTAALLLFGVASELGAFRHDGAPFYVRLKPTDIRVTGAVETTISRAQISCRSVSDSTKNFSVETYRDGEAHMKLLVSRQGENVSALFWSPALFQNRPGTGVTVNPDTRTVTLTNAPFTAPVTNQTVHLTGTYHCSTYTRH